MLADRVRTAIAKWVDRVLERDALGAAPKRLHEVAIAYANACPHATRREWVAFATAHAAEAYRVGYQRGAEHADEAVPPERSLPPEFYADQLDPNWRWRPGITLLAGGQLVPDAWAEDALERDDLELLGKVMHGEQDDGTEHGKVA